jgi:D-alanyl-D-alanine dipeptidase
MWWDKPFRLSFPGSDCLYQFNKTPMILRITCVLFFTTVQLALSAQDTLLVVHNESLYRAQVKADDANRMVELRSLAPRIRYELRYAGLNNFMKRRMYPAGTRHTFLRKPAAVALAKVQQELETQGLGLKIFDAYRPYSVTMKFWELVQDERYVAHPAKGSNHNRGLAVDLTLVNLATGNELDMGTGFDHFSDTAHHDFMQLGEEILSNRKLLKETMEKHGFRMYNEEWWHYSFPGKYDVMDLSFKFLRKEE